MVLSKDEIKKLRLLSDYVDSHFRAAGYDVTLRELLLVDPGRGAVPATPSEEYTTARHAVFTLPPRAVAIAFSREKVKLPPGICAHALPRTRLSQRGLLALSTGVIDPGYEGYISTTLINFSRQDQTICGSDSFLRLTFSEVKGLVEPESQPREDFEEYRARVLGAAACYPRTFLDVPAVASEVAKKLLWQSIGLAALLLAFISVAVSLVPIGLSNYIFREEAIRSAVREEINRVGTSGVNLGDPGRTSGSEKGIEGTP